MGEDTEFAAALVAMQAEFTTIKKNREVIIKLKDRGEFKFKYADLAAILDHMRPLMKKHAFALTSGVVGTEGMTLAVTLLHESGQSRSSLFPLHKTANPKELGSEITYMRRYGAVCLLGLATEDDDDGALGAAGGARRAKEKAEPKPRNKAKFDTASSEGKVQQLWIQAKATKTAVEHLTGEDWNAEQWVREHIATESTKDLTTEQVDDLVKKLKKIEADNTAPE